MAYLARKAADYNGQEARPGDRVDLAGVDPKRVQKLIDTRYIREIDDDSDEAKAAPKAKRKPKPKDDGRAAAGR